MNIIFYFHTFVPVLVNMTKLYFYKNFWILFLSLFVSVISIIAQERSIFHDMLRESLKMDLMEIAIPNNG